MTRNKNRFAIIATILGVLSVGIYALSPNLHTSILSNIQSISAAERDSLFNSYWYSDKAEIRTYQLNQARYGEMHQGTATLIFVTEPFLNKKGVKPDNYKTTKSKTQVLKMNFLKKFGTGIYPYSMMLSTFTPIADAQGVLKANVTGQEWCGHIFSQMRKKDNHYDVASYSYFEEEGDIKFKLPSVFTEDEIWSRIRIDYKNLPVGDIEVIPGLYYTRLEQHELKAEKANAKLSVNDKESVYTLHYPKRNRTLALTFNTSFPHEIVKWEETYADKRAPDKVLTTTATLDQARNIDYWNYNAEKHKKIRRELGVPY